MKNVSAPYIIDHNRGTITPIAPGQRFTHREYGESFVVKEVLRDAYGGITIVKDLEHSWASFSEKAEWSSEADMYMFLKFVDWAYNGPAKSDPTRFPHKCPRCQSAAYVGACGGGDVDCTNDDCPTRKR